MTHDSSPSREDTPRYKSILLLGAPGTGKGTQGEILARIPGFYHCSCGDVFRNIDVESDLGKVFYDHSSRGELVPDDVTVKMWFRAICAHAFLGEYKPQRDLLLLDGIPRTVEQAKLMEEHVEVLKVVHLTCDDEDEMIDRIRRRALKSNRADDADEKVIRNRWEVYRKDTAPVMDYFSGDKIAKVNAVGSPAEVLAEVLRVVAPIQQTAFSEYMG